MTQEYLHVIKKDPSLGFRDLLRLARIVSESLPTSTRPDRPENAYRVGFFPADRQGEGVMLLKNQKALH